MSRMYSQDCNIPSAAVAPNKNLKNISCIKPASEIFHRLQIQPCCVDGWPTSTPSSQANQVIPDPSFTCRLNLGEFQYCQPYLKQEAVTVAEIPREVPRCSRNLIKGSPSDFTFSSVSKPDSRWKQLLESDASKRVGTSHSPKWKVWLSQNMEEAEKPGVKLYPNLYVS